MEEKLICCCGASGWTRVIAWLEIIGSAFSMTAWTWLLVVFSSAANLNKRTLTPEQIQAKQNVSAFAVIAATMLILTLVAYAMALILLRGSYNQNPRDIQAWLMYTVISLIITTVLSFILCFISPLGLGAPAILINLAIVILIKGFFLWVVQRHKKEIEAPLRPLYSVPIQA